MAKRQTDAQVFRATNAAEKRRRAKLAFSRWQPVRVGRERGIVCDDAPRTAFYVTVTFKADGSDIRSVPIAAVKAVR
jgi:hypothetical protein